MSISLAFFSELIDRMSCTPGVEQNRPHLTPGVENDDLSEHISISQVRAIWNPAAAATPLTTLIVGTDRFLNWVSITVSWSKALSEAPLSLANYLRSCPEQNTGPSAFKTMILVYPDSAFFSTCCNASVNCWMVSSDRVFLFLGLANVTVVALVALSVCTFTSELK